MQNVGSLVMGYVVHGDTMYRTSTLGGRSYFGTLTTRGIDVTFSDLPCPADSGGFARRGATIHFVLRY
ncbi:MAG TPA: hypothetical protein VF041_22365 [Gemmatimonadaceae bacterium]